MADEQNKVPWWLEWLVGGALFAVGAKTVDYVGRKLMDDDNNNDEEEED